MSDEKEKVFVVVNAPEDADVGIPQIAWRSGEERLACFDAAVVLARRGVIRLSSWKETMSIIMGEWLTELDLIPQSLVEMRKGLEHRCLEGEDE